MNESAAPKLVLSIRRLRSESHPVSELIVVAASRNQVVCGIHCARRRFRRPGSTRGSRSGSRPRRRLDPELRYVGRSDDLAAVIFRKRVLSAEEIAKSVGRVEWRNANSKQAPAMESTAMRILVTGSAGHLGEALMRTLASSDHEAIGIDIKSSPYTHRVGSIADRGFVDQCMRGAEVVLHTATLHKPHIVTHTTQDFIDTNVSGTLNLLEAAIAATVKVFVFTSTTSAFGRALTPLAGEPAAWITEDVTPLPKNIYGITKLAAENLCELFHRKSGLPCVVLKTSRFFPEQDDDRTAREGHNGDNLKVNELLYRRADIEDVVDAHMLAVLKAPTLGFDRFIISATTPFTREDLHELRTDAALVLRRRCPGYEAEYVRRGWRAPQTIDRVYVNERARALLGWQPRYDFGRAIRQLHANEDYRSPLARAVGAKGYHSESFPEGPYPTS